MQSDPTIELWRNVFRDEFIYAVSNLGRVRNRKTGFVLKPSIDLTGYPYVGLFRSPRYFWRVRVHQLVAEAFLGPAQGNTVNHIDAIKTNNSLANLEYVSAGENSKHAWAMALRTPHAHEKSTTQRIADVLALADTGLTRPKIAHETGLGWHTIDAILREHRPNNKPLTVHEAALVGGLGLRRKYAVH